MIFPLFVQAQTDSFVTIWDSSKGGTTYTSISFHAATSTTVNYKWEEIGGSGGNGSGTFSTGAVSITGLPSKSKIKLFIEPAGLQRFFLNTTNVTTSSSQKLTEIVRWGDAS